MFWQKGALKIQQFAFVVFISAKSRDLRMFMLELTDLAAAITVAWLGNF
jgi:hypothetical protein